MKQIPSMVCLSFRVSVNCDCSTFFFFCFLESLLYTFNLKSFTGLFDFSAGSEFVGKEIVKCIDLAKEGIHAILVVFSIRTRFSDEEASALHSLQTLFGSKIVDYMIVVFTGGDELEDNDETLDDYLGHECPTPLKVSMSIIIRINCYSFSILYVFILCYETFYGMLFWFCIVCLHILDW